MKTNQTFKTKVIDLSHQGEGIAKVDGFPLFIQDALPGDELQVRVIQVKKSYGIATVIKIIQPSPDRINPPCDKFGQCGGCQTMSLDYEMQLSYKEKRVKDALERIGKIDTPVKPALGMKEPWGYRNKAQFPIGWSHEKLSIGFYKQGSHEIVDTDQCLIQHPVMDIARRQIRHFLTTTQMSIYDESTGKGLVRHLIVKTGFETGQVMIILVINGEDLPQEKTLISLLKDEVPGLVSVVLNSNKRKTNTIMGQNNRVIYGKDYLIDRVKDLSFQISPHAFFQVNPLQTELLYDQVLRFAGLSGKETVLDLYCGIGTITLLLAQKAYRVIGIETVDAAIKDAEANAVLNGLTNTEFIAGPAEKRIHQLQQSGITPEVIVVDPPRKGCDETVLQAMISMNPRRIVYVSCNPATLARDLRILEDGGYRTSAVQPVDMFPHTAHVETVVLMDQADHQIINEDME